MLNRARRSGAASGSTSAGGKVGPDEMAGRVPARLDALGDVEDAIVSGATDEKTGNSPGRAASASRS